MSNCSVARYKRKRRRGVDYNEEIPFEKQPPPGFYDTSEDTSDIAPPNFKRLRQQDVLGKRKEDFEMVCLTCNVCIVKPIQYNHYRPGQIVLNMEDASLKVNGVDALGLGQLTSIERVAYYCVIE